MRDSTGEANNAYVKYFRENYLKDERTIKEINFDIYDKIGDDKVKAEMENVVVNDINHIAANIKEVITTKEVADQIDEIVKSTEKMYLNKLRQLTITRSYLWFMWKFYESQSGEWEKVPMNKP